MKKVAVLVGSLRKGSLNQKLAEGIAKLAEGRLEFVFADLDLPLYNEDLWANPPASVTAFKTVVDEADAVLVVTPEYNRAMSPAIKNAIDWGSRPWGQSSWTGKPAAAIGGSLGAGGALAGVIDAAKTLGIVGSTVMMHPGVYIQLSDGLFTEGNAIANDSTAEFLSGFVDAFETWIETKA